MNKTEFKKMWKDKSITEKRRQLDKLAAEMYANKKMEGSMTDYDRLYKEHEILAGMIAEDEAALIRERMERE